MSSSSSSGKICASGLRLTSEYSKHARDVERARRAYDKR
jgi:hypothetical protein